ncbi:unnamed protein product [marine sediment metagenome]|uniref:Uncharacterized protein n=1 Tax=marine sediment metagenome TaxID=412755 RepID=X0YSS8_9ZZZZ
MNKTCNNCKHWDRTRERDMPGANSQDGYYLCARAEDTSDRYDKTEWESPMQTCDGSGYMSCLETRHDHCCNEWEAVNE